MKVYAVDLLGFGGSEKAPVKYSMELWRDLIIDFATEWIDEPFVIVGNSIGSLASLMVASFLYPSQRPLTSNATLRLPSRCKRES